MPLPCVKACSSCLSAAMASAAFMSSRVRRSHTLPAKSPAAPPPLELTRWLPSALRSRPAGAVASGADGRGRAARPLPASDAAGEVPLPPPQAARTKAAPTRTGHRVVRRVMDLPPRARVRRGRMRQTRTSDPVRRTRSEHTACPSAWIGVSCADRRHFCRSVAPPAAARRGSDGRPTAFGPAIGVRGLRISGGEALPVEVAILLPGHRGPWPPGWIEQVR